MTTRTSFADLPSPVLIELAEILCVRNHKATLASLTAVRKSVRNDTLAILWRNVHVPGWYSHEEVARWGGEVEPLIQGLWIETVFSVPPGSPWSNGSTYTASPWFLGARFLKSRLPNLRTLIQTCQKWNTCHIPFFHPSAAVDLGRLIALFEQLEVTKLAIRPEAMENLIRALEGWGGPRRREEADAVELPRSANLTLERMGKDVVRNAFELIARLYPDVIESVEINAELAPHAWFSQAEWLKALPSIRKLQHLHTLRYIIQRGSSPHLPTDPFFWPPPLHADERPSSRCMDHLATVLGRGIPGFRFLSLGYSTEWVAERAVERREGGVVKVRDKTRETWYGTKIPLPEEEERDGSGSREREEEDG